MLLISSVLQSDWVILYTFFLIFFYYDLSPNIDYSSLCYIVGPCCLSILHIIVYIWSFQTPNSSLPPHPSPRTARTLLCESVSQILFICVFFWIPHVSDITWHWSFSDLPHLVWQCLGLPMLLQMILFCSFLWLSNISHLLHPLLCQWTFGLFLSLGYCK